MVRMDPVQRVAEHVGWMLRDGPMRLTMLRRGVAGRDKVHFIEACAYAIEQGWAVRGEGDYLAPGRVRAERSATQGRRIPLADQLEERLRAPGVS